MSNDNRSVLAPVLQNVSAAEARVVWEALSELVKKQHLDVEMHPNSPHPLLLTGKTLLARMDNALFNREPT